MPSRGLSSELWDEILDNLHGDKPALSACALTCRSWRPRSQYHLFEVVVLHDTVESPLDMPRWEGLLDSPTLAVYCRELRIDSDYFIGLAEWRKIIVVFRHVRALYLQEVRIDEDFQRGIAGGFPEMGKLRLWSCPFASKPLFLRAIESWPQLHTLSLHHCYGRTMPGAPIAEVTDVARPIRVQTLSTLRACEFFAPEDFDSSALRSLNVQLNGRVDALFLAGVCKAAGESLRNLTLRLEYGVAASIFDGIPGALQCSTGLQSLAIEDVYIGRPNAGEIFWMAGILERTAAAALEVLSYDLHAVDLQPLLAVDWKRVKDAVRRTARSKTGPGPLRWHVSLVCPSQEMFDALCSALGDTIPGVSTTVSRRTSLAY